MQVELTTAEAILHVSAGAIGLLTGVIALSARKGSRLHRKPGTVFFVIMLTTAASGAYLGFLSFARLLYPWILLPALPAEGGLTLWLLIRGVNSEKWRAQAAAAEAQT